MCMDRYTLNMYIHDECVSSANILLNVAISQ